MAGVVYANHGDYQIWYQTDGDAATGRPMLVVNGFTRQCIGFPQGLVDGFVAAGSFVVRYDNREVGRSTKSPPDTHDRLADMAGDGIAVLDALGIESAHVWGMSMGGMIAQTIAVEHPTRVRSLTSVMSNTGDGASGGSTPEALEVLMAPAPEEREACIEHRVATSRVICGPHFDEAWERRRAAAEYDRCFHPDGALLQMNAIRHSGDRTDQLRSLQVPTTVIHGRVDPLVQLSGGEKVAEAIPGARLVVLDEMAHNLPEVYWPVFVEEMVALADRADAARVDRSPA